MKQPSVPTEASCVDSSDPASLSADVAVKRIKSAVGPVVGFEMVPIRNALERILARNVYSKVDVPGHTNSAMDGFAIKGSQIPIEANRELRIIDTAWAGRPYRGEVGENECVRIMTGAVMPKGTDTVIMLEQANAEAGYIRIDSNHQAGQNVRQAGEDIAQGGLALKSGKRLTPADLGVLAALGIGEVAVCRRPRVAFFSTGDELRSLGDPLEEGAIYDSNRYTIYGMLSRLGAEILDMGVIRDVREDTVDAFTQAANCADVILTSGGVSVGEADYVKQALDRIGEIKFWKVAIKPGRPLAFGRIGNAYFFGLPGNPVSVMVTFYLFVQPALRKMMGEATVEDLRLKLPCRSQLRKKPGRMEFQRGILQRDEQGQLGVHKTGPQGSGILHSMSEANCLILLPIESAGVEPGNEVEVLPLQGLI